MRSAIAKKTIIPIFLIFLVMIGVYFGLNYKYFRNLITIDNKIWLGDITASLRHQLDNCGAEDDESFREKFDSISSDMIEAFGVDYICAYEPDVQNDDIYYFALKYHPTLHRDKTPEYMNMIFDRSVDYKLTPDEAAVYNDMKDVGFMSYNNKFGYELAAVTKYKLPSGKIVIISIEKSYSTINSKVANVFRIQTLSIICVYILTCFVLYRIIMKRVSEPAARISEAMSSFISGGKHKVVKMDENINDEFGTINKAFNSMADNIDKYIKNIVELNDKQKSQKAEFDVASRIQKGLLPKEKSFFNGCKISAVMAPAKEIGGDLYDYFEIDEDNTLVTIADVSGKGVSAAVFMAVTLTLLHQFAGMKMEPAEILENTNRVLAERNPLMLFVTAFVGIYNRKKMEFTYANAGHNHPYLISSSVSSIDNALGTVLGMFEGEKYSQEKISMLPGQTLLLYTDGVNEAINGNNEFFGVERLENTLSAHKSSSKESIIESVLSDVKKFAGNTNQNDDITMLTLTAEDQHIIRLEDKTSDFSKIKDTILNSLVPQEMKIPLCLISEEIFVNLCSYAFEGIERDKEIKFSLKISDRIEVRFEDNGIEYNPLKDLAKIEDYDVDKQVGGLGKIIAFGIADEVNYEYKDNKNILTMTKYRELDNDN